MANNKNSIYSKLQDFEGVAQKLLECLNEFGPKVKGLYNAIRPESEQLGGKKELSDLHNNTYTLLNTLNKLLNSQSPVFHAKLYNEVQENEGGENKEQVEENVQVADTSIKNDPNLMKKAGNFAKEQGTDLKIVPEDNKIKEGKSYKDISIADLLKETATPEPTFIEKTAAQLIKENKAFAALINEAGRKAGKGGFGKRLSEVGFHGLNPELDAVGSLDICGFVISKDVAFDPKWFGVIDKVHKKSTAKGAKGDEEMEGFMNTGGTIPQKFYLIIYEVGPDKYNLAYENGESFYARALRTFPNKLSAEDGEYNGETILDMIIQLSDILEISFRALLIKMFGRGKFPYSRISVVDTIIGGKKWTLSDEPETEAGKEERAKIDAEIEKEEEEGEIFDPNEEGEEEIKEEGPQKVKVASNLKAKKRKGVKNKDVQQNKNDE